MILRCDFGVLGALFGMIGPMGTSSRGDNARGESIVALRVRVSTSSSLEDRGNFEIFNLNALLGVGESCKDNNWLVPAACSIALLMRQ